MSRKRFFKLRQTLIGMVIKEAKETGYYLRPLRELYGM